MPDAERLVTGTTANLERQEKSQVFRANMNLIEVQELLEATAARILQTTLAEGRNLNFENID